MKDIVIVGHGGLGKEVAFLIDEINRLTPVWNLRGFISPDKANVGKSFGKYRVCGDDEWLATTSDELAVAIAVGAPVMLHELHQRLHAYRHLTFPNLIHPRVTGDWERIRMGDGNLVLNHASFTTEITLGSGNVFNPGCTIAHDDVLGSFNAINPGANVSGGVVLGDRVLVGTGAQILQYRRVCDDTTIGAGAVVIEDINVPGTYVGVPARKLEKATA